MIAVTFFGSGSKGNAALMEFGERRFLLDAGLSCRKIQENLEQMDIPLDALSGIFVTHEHDDHVKGMRVLLSKCKKLPVFATPATLAELKLKDIEITNAVPLAIDREMEYENLRLWAFPVPHDAAAPVGFRFEYCGKAMSVATDLGHITPIVMNYLTNANILCLESNYDDEMLSKCMYPAWLKQRIRSRSGHLSNTGVRGVLSRLQRELEHLVMVHISQEANTPLLVRANVEPLLQFNNLLGTELTIAGQDTATDRCSC